MKVVFDATKLKHPNTGLYHFTRELALALERQATTHNLSLQHIVTSTVNLPYNTRTVNVIDKIFPRNPSHATIWHSSHQLYSYPPTPNVKQVLTIHDLNFLREKSDAKRTKYLQRLQREIQRADALVAISQFTKNDILRYVDTAQKPIHVIYNGCNIPEVSPLRPDNAPPTEKFLFGVGTILPKKNWHTLPALLVDNDYSLVIAGTPSNYCSAIIEQALLHNVQDRVILTGEVSEAHKQWYLQNCTAFVFPSLAEGFGLPVVEAMYHGKPLFLSPHCSLPEIAGDLAYYFPEDFSDVGMQKTLREGLEHFSSYADTEALTTRAKSFSWDTAAIQYLEIYKQLATK